MRPQRQRRRPPQAPVNKYVKAQTLTVIDNNGEKLGVYSKDDALKIAQEKGLDLLQITFDKEPCVAKILDYGKHKFTFTCKLPFTHTRHTQHRKHYQTFLSFPF